MIFIFFHKPSPKTQHTRTNNFSHWKSHKRIALIKVLFSNGKMGKKFAAHFSYLKKGILEKTTWKNGAAQQWHLLANGRSCTNTFSKSLVQSTKKKRKHFKWFFRSLRRTFSLSIASEYVCMRVWMKSELRSTNTFCFHVCHFHGNATEKISVNPFGVIDPIVSISKAGNFSEYLNAAEINNYLFYLLGRNKKWFSIENWNGKANQLRNSLALILRIFAWVYEFEIFYSENGWLICLFF